MATSLRYNPSAILKLAKLQLEKYLEFKKKVTDNTRSQKKAKRQLMDTLNSLTDDDHKLYAEKIERMIKKL